MAKFGCALALGIIDAGGRNCTIGLQTQTGNLNMTAIVGMAVFTQYWYWFPLTHFLSLSFIPTSIIGIDQDLDIPAIKFHCSTKQSMFDYPPEQEAKQEEAPEKVKTAVLSTTAQAKRRKQAKERQARRESMSMDVDQTPTTPKQPSTEDESRMDVDTAEEKKDGKDESRPSDKDGTPGPTFDINAKDATPSSTRKNPSKERVGYEIETMSRVLPPQLKYISFAHERYKFVKKVNILSTLPVIHPVSMIMLTFYHWSQPTGGVILLQDLQPHEPKQLLELKVKKTPPTPAPAPGQTMDTTGAQVDEPVTPEGDQTLARRHATDILRELAPGAEAAAGVLTAVDEDEEGVDEALAPREFEYDTDEMEE